MAQQQHDQQTQSSLESRPSATSELSACSFSKFARSYVLEPQPQLSISTNWRSQGWVWRIDSHLNSSTSKLQKAHVPHIRWRRHWTLRLFVSQISGWNPCAFVKIWNPGPRIWSVTSVTIKLSEYLILIQTWGCSSSCRWIYSYVCVYIYIYIIALCIYIYNYMTHSHTETWRWTHRGSHSCHPTQVPTWWSNCTTEVSPTTGIEFPHRCSVPSQTQPATWDSHQLKLIQSSVGQVDKPLAPKKQIDAVVNTNESEE